MSKIVENMEGYSKKDSRVYILLIMDLKIWSIFETSSL